MKNYLYVEDEGLIREAWVYFFEAFFPNHRLVAAANYQEAVEALKTQGPFNAIISDFNYAGRLEVGRANRNGMGGPDLLEHVRAENINVPFVFISGYPSTKLITDLTARNLTPPDAIFLKPVTPDVVLAHIDRIQNPSRMSALSADTFSKLAKPSVS